MLKVIKETKEITFKTLQYTFYYWGITCSCMNNNKNNNKLMFFEEASNQLARGSFQEGPLKIEV